MKKIQYPQNTYKPPVKDKYVLGVETTCDETSLALVKDGHQVISEITLSQAKQHEAYGGVVPELAGRNHLENLQKIAPIFMQEIRQYPIDAVAVSFKVGLPPAVKVGETFALGLSKALNVPLLKINHVIAHIWGVWVDAKIEHKPQFPLLGVIISGGHTMLVDFRSPTNYKIIGQTVDDAIGEVFDKVARVLDLGYPGGPYIEKWAREGDELAYHLPHSAKTKGLDMSFSGLKTATIQTYRKELERYKKTFPMYEHYLKADIAASFQAAAFSQLIDKIEQAVEKTGYKTIVLGGGVSANNRLIDMLWQKVGEKAPYIYAPSLKYCGDNAAFIAGYGINFL